MKDTKFKSLINLKNYNFGDKYVCTPDGIVYRRRFNGDTEELVKMSPFTTRDGYIEYVLTDLSGIKKHIQGHRIVAELYLMNTKNLKYVNHKDGVRNNNVVENLEWISQSDNLKHSYRVLGREPWNKKKLINL